MNYNEKKLLKQGNIYLRAPEPGDLDVLFNMENDMSLWHLSNTLTPFSRFDLEQFIMLSDKDIYVTKQARFIIEKKEDSKKTIVGAIDLFEFDPLNSRAGVGIIVFDEFRSKGLAGNALDILINYAFSHLGLHQLYCNIEENNEISLKLFQKKGFVECGKKLEWNKSGNRWENEIMLQLITNI